MSIDVIDLREFYARPLGQVTRRVLRAKLRARWADVHGMRVLGLGYATPFMGPFREEAERLLAFMPAAQGASDWPAGRPAATALVEADMWPLPDAAVDRVLVAHALEFVASPDELLREVWRCLAPGGRLLAIVPSRRGPWARFDVTPFGHGRPFSASQLSRLLRGTAFAPISWGEALLFPPLEIGLVLRSAIALERIGSALWTPFAGVHVVEATKEMQRPVRVRRAAQVALRPATAPVLGAPAPAPAPPG